MALRHVQQVMFHPMVPSSLVIVRRPRGKAFRWTATGGMVSIGSVPDVDDNTEANATSADGTVIVGRSISGGTQAFIWTANGGARYVLELLTNDFGLNLTGWTLSTAHDVSADGRTIVGHDTNPYGDTEGWIAIIPEPSTIFLMFPIAFPLLRRKRR